MKIDLFKFKDIQIIYKTKKCQYWGISSVGVKQHIGLEVFNILAKTKVLVSYIDSKLFKKGVNFIIFNDCYVRVVYHNKIFVIKGINNRGISNKLFNSSFLGCHRQFNVCLPTNSGLSSMAPQPFLKWVGGKQDLLSVIGKKLPQKFNNYHEFFLGGGSVLFYVLYLYNIGQITLQGKVYAYDLNKDLINVYQVIQKNYELLFDYLSFYSERYCENNSLAGKKKYYLDIRNKYNNDNLCNVERAAVFIFLNKTCFRGLYREGPNGFNVSFGNYSNPVIRFERERLAFLSSFIQGVIFQNVGFEESFKNLKKGDFVYLDPPYVPYKSSSFVHYTRESFTWEKHKLLFTLTKELMHKGILFLMSNSDTEFVRNFFKDFFIERVVARRRINVKNSNFKQVELLIYNNKIK